MTHIEQLGQDEFDELLQLFAFAFQYTSDDEAFEQTKKEVARDQIFGYKIEGRLAGQLHIIPMHIYMGDQLFKMGGVSSVATWPEYRRQGVAKSLMNHALKEMKENGQTVSLLHPFQIGFYRKFGWELVFVNKHYTVPIDRLKGNWQTEGYIRRTLDRQLLQVIYADYAKKLNGMLDRSDSWWKQDVLTDEASQIRVAYDSSDTAEAYIIYKVLDNILTVLDFAYTTDNGLRQLYKFMGHHDSMAKEVKMTVPEHDLLPLRLADPVFEQKLEPYMMARIVDVFGFLQQYAFSAVHESIVIEVADEWVPDNNGSYQVKTNQSHAVVTKMKHGTLSDIQSSIQQLTSLLFSFKRAPELYEHGMITGDETAIQRLDQMIPRRQPFVADFF